jgi:hypothetical protein
MQTKTKVNIREEGWRDVMLRTAIQFQMVELIRTLPPEENPTNAELHRLADAWEKIN